MESGYAWRPITVRREGPQTIAQSVMGTFVSGNFFRVFGLTSAAGRFFVDADDKKGAPICAVMSFKTWQQDFAADPSVIGGTFWINTKIFGHRRGLCWPPFRLSIVCDSSGSRRSPPSKGVANWRTDLFAVFASMPGELASSALSVRSSQHWHRVRQLARCKWRTHPKPARWRTGKLGVRAPVRRVLVGGNSGGFLNPGM
jgi:hypothetical protein